MLDTSEESCNEGFDDCQNETYVQPLNDVKNTPASVENLHNSPSVELRKSKRTFRPPQHLTYMAIKN